MPLLSRVRDGDAVLFLSVITEAELLVRPNRNGDTEAMERIGDFLSEDGIYIVEVDRRIARRAAAVRTTNRIGLADAMIMATAIEASCDLVVGNDKDWAGRTGPAAFVLLDDLQG
jgi:predicted nucleic acid-binding protein